MADEKRTSAFDNDSGNLSDATTVALETEKTNPLLEGDMRSAPPLDQRIGPYRIIRELGRGGMGAVYLAARADDQYQKLVAIKVVVRGLDTDFALQRFRAERQILASLDHPNIARLLDGGTTADGRPFFVMEYIEGRPIIEYSDENKLSIEDRLKLFRDVCSAVQYSHQNLVIHRDIKPGNILVTAEGVAKLLDFGIAKILNPDLYPLGVDQTQTAMRLMTPQYASPEQARGEPITTATDVYLLGVLLYELLTGRRPYQITSSAPHDIIQVICEQEPDRPSTAVTRITKATSGNDKAAVTAQSVSASNIGEGNLEKLRRRLAGDIDTIVLKAIRKDPAERYGSVEQLSEDIRRHLEGKPISARPDTLFYRTSKFIRRNRLAVAAVVLIILSLLGGIIATAWQASVARTQRARAERRFNDVRKLANTFLFEFNDAIENLPGSTPARELLVKRAVEYLDSLAQESSDDPSLQRELAIAYKRVGDLQGNPYMWNLGDIEGALASYRKSVSISEALLAIDSSSTEDQHALAMSLAGIGDLLWVKGETGEAINYYQRALEYEPAVVAPGKSDKEARRYLWSIYRRMGAAQAGAGNLEAAVATLGKAREIVEAMVAEDPTNSQMRGRMANNYTDLGQVIGEQGDLTAAIDYFHKALAIEEELLASDPNNVEYKVRVGGTLSYIGDALKLRGDTKGALESYQKALSLLEYVSNADPSNAQASRNLAILHDGVGEMLSKANDFAGGLTHLRKAVEISEKLASADPSNIFVRGEAALYNSQIGIALARKGDEEGAFEASAKALNIAETLSKENPDTVELSGALVKLHFNDGEIGSLLAEKEKVSRDRQVELWQRARESYQRSLDIFNGLRSRGAWTSVEFGSQEDIEKNIARCDAALAKLGIVTR